MKITSWFEHDWSNQSTRMRQVQDVAHVLIEEER